LLYAQKELLKAAFKGAKNQALTAFNMNPQKFALFQ
jgi:hypothetical protein